MTLWGSLVFAAPSSNATIILIFVVGVLSVGEHLNKVAVSTPGIAGLVTSVVYYAIPHLEFYDLRRVVVHNWPPRSWLAVGMATLYGALYSTAFLTAGWLVFRRKVLTR
jgi:hypothetical protein